MTADAVLDDMLAMLEEPVAASESDAVEAMQELLLRHEQEHLHEVEDPGLVRALDEIRSIAHSNIADVFEHVAVESYAGVDDEGEVITSSFDRLQVSDITKLPRHVSAAIKEVRVERRADGDVITVKLYDKLVALDKLLRYHGAYERDNAQRAKGATGVLELLMSSIGAAGLPVIEDNRA